MCSAQVAGDMDLLFRERIDADVVHAGDDVKSALLYVNCRIALNRNSG